MANVVDGCIALIYANCIGEWSPLEIKILKNCVKFVMRHVRNDGLPSMALDVSSVHCTAMGLFFLELVRERNLYSFSRTEQDKILVLRNSLLNSCQSWGWGFKNHAVKRSEDVRFFSTFWALRALNAAGVHKELEKTIWEIVRQVPLEEMGFSFKDKFTKVSMLSLFVIMLMELKNEKLKTDVLEFIEIAPIAETILDSLIEEKFVEVEEFKSPLNEGPEWIGWVHISAGLGLQALSLLHEHLSYPQERKLNRVIGEVIVKERMKDKYFSDLSLTQSPRNLLTYPTMHVMNGLCYWKEYISSKQPVVMRSPIFSIISG